MCGEEFRIRTREGCEDAARALTSGQFTYSDSQPLMPNSYTPVAADGTYGVAGGEKALFVASPYGDVRVYDISLRLQLRQRIHYVTTASPVPGGPVAGWRVHVDYCGG